jgi:hypothetical protein
METSTMVLTSKHETPWTDEEPQTNVKAACVCATPSLNRLTRLVTGARRIPIDLEKRSYTF